MRACKLVPEPDMRTINLVSEFAMMNSFKCYIQMLMRKCICMYYTEALNYNKACARNGKLKLPAIHRQPHPHEWFQKIVM